MNIERILDRIEQLEEFLRNFPEGMFADAARNELAHLDKLLEKYG